MELYESKRTIRKEPAYTMIAIKSIVTAQDIVDFENGKDMGITCIRKCISDLSNKGYWDVWRKVSGKPLCSTELQNKIRIGTLISLEITRAIKNQMEIDLELPITPLEGF